MPTISCLLALALFLAAPLTHAQAINAVQTNSNAAAMPADANPSFEVATIKISTSTSPGFVILNIQGQHYYARNVSLQRLLKFAYSLQDSQIINLPKFGDEERYDIAAVMQPEGRPNGDQIRIMLRKLLADRFKLVTHTEQRTLPVYILTAPNGTGKLKPSTFTTVSDSEREVPDGMEFTLRGATPTSYANYLQQALLNRPVVDHTGLTTRFDYSVIFMPDETMFNGRFRASPEMQEKGAPNFFTALTESTGLKLTPDKAPVEVLVIDHAEPPSAN